MIVGTMVEEIFNELGEHTDCDPYVGGALTPTSPGYRRILGWINSAYAFVSCYKFRNTGRQLRFRELERTERLQTITTTAPVYTAGDSPVIGPAATYVDGLFENWVVEDAQGELYEVMQSVRSGAPGAYYLTLDFCHPFTGLLGDTLNLYRRDYTIRTGLGVFEWTLSARPLSISRIFDLSQEVEIARASRRDTLFSGRREIGDPSMFAERGSSIVFDRAFDDTRWLRMDYYALPDPLSNTDVNDEPIIPEHYHTAIKKWAIHLGMLQKEEYDDGWKASGNFDTYMASLRTPAELEDEVSTKRWRIDTGRL